MKFLVGLVFLAVVGFGACEDTSCYNDVVDECKASVNIGLINCNAKYGAIAKVEKDLQKFANAHITDSFNYLLLSTRFGNYQANRPGFQSLFRKMSDSTWEDAIDVIKHLTKRGGVMDFNALETVATPTQTTVELHEFASLARALDLQKTLANQTQHIHREVTRQHEPFHDPEVASFLENHFVHKHADSIRDLSGHLNDLHRLLKNNKDPSLALFLFDEHLQKM